MLRQSCLTIAPFANDDSPGTWLPR